MQILTPLSDFKKQKEENKRRKIVKGLLGVAALFSLLYALKTGEFSFYAFSLGLGVAIKML
jgi:hypothetical protein